MLFGQPIKNQDIHRLYKWLNNLCSRLNDLKGTWLYLNEIILRFSPEMKTKSYDFIGDNVFLRKVTSFLDKKG